MLEIIYRGYSNADKRVKEDLKKFYWKENEEPTDWDLFDGEIRVEKRQDKGGDTAFISFHGENASILKRQVKSFLNDKSDVQSIGDV